MNVLSLSSTPQNMLITQTQKAIAFEFQDQELNFNHPMKYLVATNTYGALTMQNETPN